ncbi:MAG: electron transfer flavoprotein subunit beta/FixA family protein [Deltaproteobacteria bacterium]|nr:electron transfer flavoprotein subunit beta/FixA family protein [Deltaproteobacteria bacterium]MBT4265893.1 electron transfer flavoprotein subunit beta/FixA family protein [Deltaproteobacteria bacterium]MBT4643685.1 electron transfer flavoprotein subunit beta/FixA family protein [Deltaproteobacteria bacterium]MBT6614265.1 electron transfer flavoprotein subunit beta/FixA family protein [Deltaproteobacteria bacterium]MBT7153495.1 electron transfer flavoprotein subunit beta/FixA family protein 
MLKLVTCIKQVPMVSELPWDPRTGTLKRNLADGMINPACRYALEAALILKNTYGAEITAITMGSDIAEEVLREAFAMGADRGILVSDPKMAGADTLATSLVLSRAVQTACADFDLILCGCHTSDSETAQVGPQMIEELDIPGVTYVDRLELDGRLLRLQRLSDNFIETLEMELPGLVTITTQRQAPRYVPLAGLQDAFTDKDISRLSLEDLDLDPELTGAKGSPTKIINVFSPTAEKDNIIMKGSARKIVQQLFDQFDDKIGGAIGKDIKDYQESQ